MDYVDLQRRHEEQAQYRRERAGFWDDMADGRYLTPIAAIVLLAAGFGVGIPSLLASLSPPGLVEFFIVAAPLIPAAACIWVGSMLWLAWSRKSVSHAPKKSSKKSGTEKQLLLTLRESNGLTAVEAALETSLTVDEAEEILTRFADRGHLVVESRDGALFYTLPGRSPAPETRTV